MRKLYFTIIFTCISLFVQAQSAIVQLKNVTVSGKIVTFDIALEPSIGSIIYLGNFDITIDFESTNTVASVEDLLNPALKNTNGATIDIFPSIFNTGRKINYSPPSVGSANAFKSQIARIDGLVSLGTYKITFNNIPTGTIQCGGSLVYTLDPDATKSPQFLSSLVSTTCLGTAALPLDLLEFSANSAEESTKPMALLSWKTANEQNVDFFEIQKSVDSKQFSSFGKVSAKNGSAQSYQFVDEKPFSGISYYRLKMMDKDGSYTYSAIKSIAFKDVKKTTFKVYPNPTNHVLNLQIERITEGVGQFEIVDITGRIINSFNKPLAEGYNEVTVDIQSLPRGLYFIKVKDSDKNEAILKVTKI